MRDSDTHTSIPSPPPELCIRKIKECTIQHTKCKDRKLGTYPTDHTSLPFGLSGT
jgi:hypothetical protein